MLTGDFRKEGRPVTLPCSRDRHKQCEWLGYSERQGAAGWATVRDKEPLMAVLPRVLCGPLFVITV